MKKGMFLSDIHMPFNIRLTPLFSYMEDLKPDIVILGGDVIDASGMHGIESMKASEVNLNHYNRDVKLLKGMFKTVSGLAKKVVFLEGNHEERYRRVVSKYPDLFGSLFNLQRDTCLPEYGVDWVPYGAYSSSYIIGDCAFIHGTIWPDNHAKAYALRHTPYKVIYGHLHHLQAYTTHRANPAMNPRYAITAGCLTNLSPEWKKGEAHQWVNGFISFIYDEKTVIPTIHMIENGKFSAGGKVYS